MNLPRLKFCPPCDEWYPLHRFYKGTHSCKECHKAYVKDWTRRHPGKDAEYSARYRKRKVLERLRETMERRGRGY